jgi:geranylgeranyl pyrophosphate synthase
MPTMNCDHYLSLFNQYLAERAKEYFPLQARLNESITYSLLAGGKRIRPLFCLGFSQAFKGQIEVALRCSLAIEMIHTYSLIHDDLPAMDNDDLRRGKPTNHIVFGEAMAILAGDSLLNAAPEILLKELRHLNFSPSLIIELTTKLLEASGHNGMIKGQALDIEAERLNSEGSFDQIDVKTIHESKTGQLITWSCLAGLYTTGDETTIKNNCALVTELGERFGLLFQIVDDLLDETALASEIGKTPGKDKQAGKLTFIREYGVETTIKMANNLLAEIHESISHLKKQGGNWLVIEELQL